MATILVVDDSRLSRSMAAEPLRMAGHTVIEAADGRLGIAAYKRNSPDCILTDLLMPNVDGHELIRRIRSLDREVPIIVLTADIQASTVVACRKMGIEAFLNKPVDAAQVLATVAHALERTGGSAVMPVNIEPCEALSELVNIGVGRAAAALNSLCGERIELSIPRVEVGKAACLGQFLPDTEEPLETLVVQDFRGGLFGRAVLALPRSSRDKCGALLGYFVGSELAEADRDEIVVEVGNMVLNAVLGVIANCLRVSIVCTVPELSTETDLPALMAGHEAVGKNGEPGVFVAHALFRVANQSLPGAVVAIFELDTVAKLLASLGGQA